MYSILDRYVMKEIGKLFLLVLFTVTFVAILGKILEIMNLLVGRGLGVTSLAQLILLFSPSLLIITIPISFIVALLIAVGRLSADNELTALKAAGGSLAVLLKPVGTLAVFFFLLTTLVFHFLFPYANKEMKNLVFNLAATNVSMGIQEKVFHTHFPGIVIYAEEVDPQSGQLRGVIISDRRLADEPGNFYAKRALLVFDQTAQKAALRLEEGSMHLVDFDDLTYRRIRFASYDFRLDLAAAISGPGGARQISRQEMTVYELWQKLASMDKSSLAYRETAIELHKRFTLPVSCLVFGFLGIPLGIRAQRSVKSRGLALGLILTLSYYLLQMSGDALVEKGWLPVAMGAWMPNFLFLTLGILLFELARRETSPRVFITGFIKRRAAKGAG